MHFTEKTDIKKKTLDLCKVLINEARNRSHIYLIASGDIAFSGKDAEYQIASKFFSTIKQLLQNNDPTLIIEFLFVPGNHDCDFGDLDTQMRKIALNNLSYLTLGSDNSVIDTCLAVQRSFWQFYKQYQSEPSDKLFYVVKKTINETDIFFYCINTAWTSKRTEKNGEVFFPVKKYLSLIESNPGIHIGIWHHPYNWFATNTPENNKKEFEKFTETIAAVHLFGHEHEYSHYYSSNKSSGKSIHLLSGEVFHQDKEPNKSGFQIIGLDLDSSHGEFKKYEFSEPLYIEKESRVIDFAKRTGLSFEIKKEFAQSLNELKIPLVISQRNSVKLSDVFVFPDLDPIGKEGNSFFENYIDASTLLNSQNKHAVLTGESQTGKTSLLSYLYLKFYENGFTPVLLSGKDIKDDSLSKYIKKAFKQQYNASELDINKFEQLAIEKKVLLVDDYHESKINSEYTKKIITQAIKSFGGAFFFISSEEMLVPAIRTDFHEISLFRILPLGYKKRNELIERYLMLKENKYTINEQSFLDQVQTSFDMVQRVLGDKLMPSYPIFILSILQAIEYKPLKQSETSSAYCYQTLLHYSLHKAGVGNEELDTFFNFLTELAYDFVVSKKERISRADLNDFYLKYSNSYISPSYDTLIKTIKKATIITESDNEISFGYNYILYYLSGKKIADILHTKEGQNVVELLFKEVHLERNANILVFITHHSKDISFIEQCLLNSMLVLDTTKPITIEKNDSFYKEIEELVLAVKNDVLEINKSSREVREKMLIRRDRQTAEIEKIRNEEPESTMEQNELVLPFHRSIRSIEIVGQIIRNRKGSLPKEQLVDMIEELYTAGFRTIGYLTSLVSGTKKDIIEMIYQEARDKTDAVEIEKRIDRFIQILCYEACKNIFGKLMHCAGNKELKDLYTTVASRINTPAAKLVSFGINSYYNTINVEEVKKLAEEFSNNHVALQLLRGRVRGYIYHRNPDFKIKQQLASCLNMRLSSVTQPGSRSSKQ